MALLRILILFLCFSLLSFSQEVDYFRGQLLDIQTKEPIPFATIRLKDQSIGVISNQDGGFRIPRRFERLGQELIVSCMGYSRTELQLDELSLEFVNTIELEPGVLELSEAVIVGRRKRPYLPGK